MSRSAKAILFLFALFFVAWAAASLYFTIAGRDIQGDFWSDWVPPQTSLAPDENAYIHIKHFSEHLHDTTNTTTFGTTYKLMRAYLDGTTNRLDFANEAKAFLVAESNTLAVARQILSSQGISVPLEEVVSASSHFCLLMRIANIYKVKATTEAADGDLTAARHTLMDLYRIGHFLVQSDSLAGISQLIGGTICDVALNEASKPLFAPDEDEAWRAKLRELYLAQLADDDVRTKTALRRHIAGYARQLAAMACSNDRKKLIYSAISSANPFGELTFRNCSVDSSRVALRWLERDFTVALLFAFPGYAGYAFQPNRQLVAYRAAAEALFQKIDTGRYDPDYAREQARVKKNPLTRNWLGEEQVDEVALRGTYKFLFRKRFAARASAAALACRSYKAKYGAYPKTLSALVPEFLADVPLDPYDGEPLRYDAERFFIWTRGEELSFNGNVEFGKDGKPSWNHGRDRHCVRFIERF